MNDAIMSRDIALALIDADPDQPRRHFADDALDELAGSLRQNGHAVPIRGERAPLLGVRYVLLRLLVPACHSAGTGCALEARSR